MSSTFLSAVAYRAFECMDQAQRDHAYDNGTACGGQNGVWLNEWRKMRKVEATAQRKDVLFLDMAYGNERHQQLDLLPAYAAAASAPTLIWFHGGYWQLPNPKENMAFVAAALRRDGANVVMVEYAGLPDPSPQPLGVQCEQALAAIEYVARAQQTQALPGDPERIVVGGHSAGGQLAAVCATHPRTRGLIAGAVAVSALSDLEPVRRTFVNITLGEGAKAVPLISVADAATWSPLEMIRRVPADAEHTAYVPVVVAVGGAELPELRRQSRELHEAFLAHGHPCTHLELAQCNHFEVLDGLSDGDGALFLATSALLFSSQSSCDGPRALPPPHIRGDEAHFTESTMGYWQTILEADALPQHQPPWRHGYPARLPDGRFLVLPIRQLSTNVSHAVASLICNQASLGVIETLGRMLAERLAARLAPLGPDVVVVGVPTLGLTFAPVVARCLGLDRYVPLGYSRKFWYDDDLSAAVRSITAPAGRRVYLDPNLLPMVKGRRVVLIDDAVSSGSTLEAPWALLERLGVDVLACGVAMLQGTRWKETLGSERAARVVGVFESPLLQADPGGWVERV